MLDSALDTNCDGRLLATSAAVCVQEISDVAADLAETQRDSVGNPVVLALLVAKASIVAEQGVHLHLLEALRAATEPLTANEVATAVGVSRPTAQRYLAWLHEHGHVERQLRYGTAGRPSHCYTVT